jgi:hypothetical protein
MTFGPTKGRERREVPLPRFLIDELARQVTGRSAGDLVFVGERGAVMQSQTFQRTALTEAAEALGIPGFIRMSYGTRLRAWLSPPVLM